MANRIYRGPADRQPKTVSDKTVAGAYLPGTFVTEGASALTQATAHAPGLRLLASRDFYADPNAAFTATDPLLTAYASGDSGVAYKLEVGQEYQAAVAAATYTYMQELKVAAAGRVAAAASGDIVVAFAKGSGAKSAGDLMDVEIATFYTKP
jgi:hypothetical protein